MKKALGGHGARNRRSIVGIGQALALGLTAVCGSVHAAYTCADLAAVTTADSTVTSAATVAAGTNVNGAVLPVAACRVQGVARPSTDSEIKWEVWLPDNKAAWTGRMKVNGTGGYAGATPYPRLAQDVGDGMVSAGSNMGHDGGESATWTLGHPEKVKDWGLRAHYSVATAAKTLATVYFGSPVRHSYFEGCSNGGRQAMMMAQNYPELFDGIVAGAPSQWYPDLLMWLLWTGKTLTPTLGGPPSISTDKRAAITQRALQVCDANDGLVDGQITNPRACNFNIDTMGPSGDGTLTADEVTIAKRMYGGTHRDWNDLASEQRYTGAKYGSEADWSPLFADNGGYGPFIGHYVYSLLSPPFDWRRDINLGQRLRLCEGGADAGHRGTEPGHPALHRARRQADPDGRMERLGRAARRLGRLLPVAGAVGARSQNLPSRVVDREIEKLTPQSVQAQANAFGDQVRQYHRLFLLPATGHCGGSTGPNSIGGGMPEPPNAYRDADHHVVSALMKWVEQGVAPEKIVATKFDSSGALTRARPVCAYPDEAAYNGSGDINDAANFSCKTPKPKDRVVTESDLVNVRNALTQRNLELPNR